MECEPEDYSSSSVEIEHGKTLHIAVIAISNIMIETGEREVFFQVNGQLRSMKVKDRKATKDQKFHPKVDRNNGNQIGKLGRWLSLQCSAFIESRRTDARSSAGHQGEGGRLDSQGRYSDRSQCYEGQTCRHRLRPLQTFHLDGNRGQKHGCW